MFSSVGRHGDPHYWLRMLLAAWLLWSTATCGGLLVFGWKIFWMMFGCLLELFKFLLMLLYMMLFQPVPGWLGAAPAPNPDNVVITVDLDGGDMVEPDLLEVGFDVVEDEEPPPPPELLPEPEPQPDEWELRERPKLKPPKRMESKLIIATLGTQAETSGILGVLSSGDDLDDVFGSLELMDGTAGLGSSGFISSRPESPPDPVPSMRIGGMTDATGGVPGGVVGGVIRGPGSFDSQRFRTVQSSEMTVTRRVPPKYPKAARDMDVSGTCRVRVTVDEGGKPTRVVPLRCPRVFHESARKALMQWRWEPFEDEGKRIEVQFAMVVRFELAE